MMELTEDALSRYSRQLSLREIGRRGQEQLARASVLVVGAGGVGSPALLYLAAAGIGRLGIVDGDEVELSNLQRQVLYGSATMGARKVTAAAARLMDLNTLVAVDSHDVRLTAANAREIMSRYDVIVDASDNLPARYLASDTCAVLDKPLVHGSVLRLEGRLTVFDARRGPCYRCLYPVAAPPELMPQGAQSGVLGAVPGVIGSLAAAEALKLVLGAGEPLIGRLLIFDALDARFAEIKFRKDPNCGVCGTTSGKRPVEPPAGSEDEVRR